MRYLRLRHLNNDGKDYVKEQDEFCKDLSIDDLSKLSRKRWEENK